MSDRVIPFTGNPLDREAIKRRDPAWLDAMRKDDDGRYLPIAKLEVLLKKGERRALAWARRELFGGHEVPEPIFLGSLDGVPHFAVDVSAVEDPTEAFGVEEVASFEDVRGAVALMSQEDAAMACHGRAFVDWHARHGFCAVCGASTRQMLGGNHRQCTECSAEHFPRVDPVGIAAVVKDDRVLLGRGPGWPDNMFSALAGFMEPGESLEEVVRREVFEEAGIEVGEVRYVASQPWTFPSSLMIGCLAQALSTEIDVDRAELEEARWFTREQIAKGLSGDTSEVMVPPPMAIAHHLLRAWVEESG